MFGDYGCWLKSLSPYGITGYPLFGASLKLRVEPKIRFPSPIPLYLLLILHDKYNIIQRLCLDRVTPSNFSALVMSRRCSSNNTEARRINTLLSK